MIKNEDIFDSNLFDDEIKKALELAKSLETLEESFKEILKSTKTLETKNAFKNYDGIKKLESEISNLETAITGLETIEKERNELLKQTTILTQKYEKELKDLATETENLENKKTDLLLKEAKEIDNLKTINNLLNVNKNRINQLTNSTKALNAIKNKDVTTTLQQIRTYRNLETEINKTIQLQNQLSSGGTTVTNTNSSVNITTYDKIKNSILGATNALFRFSSASRRAGNEALNASQDVTKLDKALDKIRNAKVKVSAAIGGFFGGFAGGLASGGISAITKTFISTKENANQFQTILKSMVALGVRLVKVLLEGFNKIFMAFGKITGLITTFEITVGGVKKTGDELEKIKDEIDAIISKYENATITSESFFEIGIENAKKYKEFVKQANDELGSLSDAQIEALYSEKIGGGDTLSTSVKRRKLIYQNVQELITKSGIESLKSLETKAVTDILSFRSKPFDVEDNVKVIDELIKKSEELDITITKTGESITSAFDGTMVGDIFAYIEGLTKTASGLVKLQVAVDSARLELNTLNDEYVKFIELSQDGTLSLETQNEYLQKAEDSAIKLRKAEEVLAKAEFELAKQRIAIATGKPITEINDELIKNVTMAGKISQEEADAYINARNAVEDVEINHNARLREIYATRRQILSDIFEQQLDLQIDGADRLKSINESIIDDENKSLQERVNAYENNAKLLGESFNKISEMFIQLQKDMFKSTTDYPETILNLTEMNKLFSDFKTNKITIDELNKRIKDFGFSNTQVTRLQEFIREWAQFTYDLETSNKTIIDSQINFLFNDENIKNQEKYLDNLKQINLLLQNASAISDPKARAKFVEDNLKKIDDLVNEYSDKELETQIKQKQDLIKINENLGLDTIQLQNELNELLIQQQINQYQKEKELAEKNAQTKVDIEQKAMDKRLEITKAAFTLLNALNDKVSNDMLSKIDREIEGVTNREQYLLALAEKGSERLTENLAFEQKKQAELELKREQVEKARARRALAISALETYNTNLIEFQKTGDTNASGKAFSKTLIDVALLQALVQALPTFYEGTENTGDGGDLDNKGGFLSILHPNERVLTAKQNQIIGNISNDELVKKVKSNDDSLKVINLEKKLDELIKVTQNKETYLGGDYNQISKTFVEKIKQQNNIINKHNKTNNLW